MMVPPGRFPRAAPKRHPRPETTPRGGAVVMPRAASGLGQVLGIVPAASVEELLRLALVAAGVGQGLVGQLFLALLDLAVPVAHRAVGCLDDRIVGPVGIVRRHGVMLPTAECRQSGRL